MEYFREGGSEKHADEILRLTALGAGTACRPMLTTIQFGLNGVAFIASSIQFETDVIQFGTERSSFMPELKHDVVNKTTFETD